jgi:hypothetical protein
VRRIIIKGTLIMVILSVMITFSSMAAEISGNANFYFTNNYFWRITTLNVEDPHLQYDFSPSASIGKFAVSFTPWISYNLSKKEADEIDYTLDLSYSISDSISTNAGAIYYDVTGIPETIELYGALEYSAEIAKLVSISPGLKFYYDIKEIKKGYIEPSISFSTPKFSYVSLSSILGLDLGQFELPDENGELVADTKLTTLQIGLSGEYEVYKGVTVAPSFTYVIGLHDGIDNTSFAGLKINFEF